jgi:uncharacterized protein YukE
VRQNVHHPRQLADADDTAFRHVTDVRLTVERQKVVLAQGVEGDAAQDHHLLVLLLEPAVQRLQRVLVQPRKQLGVHSADALRRLEQTLACAILADRRDYLADGSGDAFLVNDG